MNYNFFYLLVAILGLIVGSFLTALVSRYGAKTMFRGRSSCSSCGSTLGFLDLIPVISFLIQKGYCRYCESKISRSYIATELLSVTVFLFIFHTLVQKYGFSQEVLFLFFLYLVAYSSLLALSLYDLKHYIIPDGMVAVFIGTGYVARIYELIYTAERITYLDVLAGPIVALPFLIIWLVSRGTWIGFGDVKLAIGIGAVSGIVQGFSGIILGVWAGALISLLILIFSRTGLSFGKRGKSLTMKSEVPFGPYLALGTLLAFLFFPDVLQLSLLFNL